MGQLDMIVYFESLLDSITLSTIEHLTWVAQPRKSVSEIDTLNENVAVRIWLTILLLPVNLVSYLR